MLPMLYSTDSGSIRSLIVQSEEPMEWQRYKDRVHWSASGLADGLQPNQIGDWSLKPSVKTSPIETYVVEDERYNPSAELARIFENISQRVGAGHDTRPPLSYLLTCTKFQWVRSDDNKPLTPTKIKHNEAFAFMQTFTQDWVTNWGKPNDDKTDWTLKDYLQLSARFYYFYSNINDLQQDDIDEINANVRLYCDVGLNQAKGATEYTFGTVAKNLLGFCWRSLAYDVANPQSYRACARQWCTRVFNENARKDIKSCNNRCSTALSRGRNAKTDVKHESIFIEVGK